MWNKTKATQKLGIKYPIIQGPFGGKFSSTKLTSKVSNLGGIGSFGLNAYGPEEILGIDKELKVLTDKPYVLNLWVPLKDDPVKRYTQADFEELKQLFKPYFDQFGVPLPETPRIESPNFEEQVEAVLQARPPVASFIYGVPSSKVIRELKEAGIITMATATTPEEVLAIEAAKIDLVIASGAEAGGHRAFFLGSPESRLLDLSSLLQQIKGKVAIPVIAAGGISTGKDVAKALRLGADAVQIGTAFLATKESNASEEHKARLRSPNGYDTSLTNIYTGRPARAINNQFSKDFARIGTKKIAPFPIQSAFLSPLRKAAIEQKRWEYVAFWAGIASGVLQYRSAEDLFISLVQRLDEIFVGVSI